jgi:chaperonin GroES
MKLDKILLSTNILDKMKDKDKEGLLNNIKAESANDMKEHEARTKEHEELIKHSKIQRDEPKKNFPWEGASNVKYPLILSESNSIAAMLSTAILQDDIVKGVVIGADEIEVIDNQSEEGAKMQPLGKTDKAERVAKYTNYLLKYGIDDWEESTDYMFNKLALMGAQFKKTYYCTIESKVKSELIDFKDIIISDAMSLESADIKIHKFELSKSEIVSRIRAGVYVEIDLEELNEDTKYVVCENHMYYDLDEDGYKEPYVATYMKEGQFLSMVKRFDADMVKLNGKKEVINIEPIEHFTKYPFIKDATNSMYDIGFGQLLMPLNKTINSIINQLIDAGTLANTQGGIIGGGSGLKSGSSLRVKMGEYKMIPEAMDLKNNIVELTGKEPSQTLFLLLGTLTQSAKEITSIKNINPESVGMNTPATTTLYMIEQGLNEFKAIYKRIHRALGEEVQKILFFENKYGSKDEYLDVMDYGKANAKDLEESKDYKIEPVNGSSSLTEGQNITRANAVYQARLDNPYIDAKEATEFYLKALKVGNVPDFMTEPPQPQPDPMAELQLQLMNSQKQLLDMQSVNIKEDNKRRDIEVISKANVEALKAENDTLTARVNALAKIVDISAKDKDLKKEKAELSSLAGKKLTINDMEGGIK